MVEQFNHHYQQKFLDRLAMQTAEQLQASALVFEHKHNSSYRYSILNGQTPLEALAQTGKRPLRFPPDGPAPATPLCKPRPARYHLIRFIRGDDKLGVFGERFWVVPELQYEYVVATIDVKVQKLKLIHDQLQVDECDYKLC